MDAWRFRLLIVGGCLASLGTAPSIVPVVWTSEGSLDLAALLRGRASGPTRVWSWEEQADLYILSRSRGPRRTPNNIVVVPIDSQARVSLYLPASDQDFDRCRDVRVGAAPPGYRNPDPAEILTRWPRCLHARVLDALAAGQPEAVVMDISFRPRSDPSGVYSEQDRALAATIRRLGNVVLVRKIKIEYEKDERAQPIAREIESAALAVAPFLLIGDEPQRADKFCTFKEDHGWSGPCLPAVVYQVASLELYPELHKLLEVAARENENVDLVPARQDSLVAYGALQAPVSLIRHVAKSDPRISERIRALLAIEETTAVAAHLARMRSLADVYLGPGIRYFNFYGPPNAFPTLRYETLAAGAETERPAPGSLRGKVVFIGFAESIAPEPVEHFTTPFTKKLRLSGVEAAATAYANLQDGSTIVPALWQVRALIALLVGTLCTLFWVTFARTPRGSEPSSCWRALLSCAILGFIYFGASLYFFAVQAFWLPVLIPLGFVGPIATTAGFVCWHLEVKRRSDRAYRFLLSLVPKREADRIMTNNEELVRLLDNAGESVYATCVFTDAQGFTALAKSHSPDEVVQIMREYFKTLFLVIEEEGGEVSDTAGDGMLAVWAGVKPDASLRKDACNASLRLAEAAERLNRTRPEQALPTRIGVDYGRMSRGMLGRLSHMEYRHMGGVANLANRLQQLNKQLGTRVLVSESVIHGSGGPEDSLRLDGPDGFLVRDLGVFKLDQGETPTRVYELVDKRAWAKGQHVATQATPAG